MSRFLQSIYSADRVNQATAVLGGATAPAYDILSLHTHSTALSHLAKLTGSTPTETTYEHIFSEREGTVVAGEHPGFQLPPIPAESQVSTAVLLEDTVRVVSEAVTQSAPDQDLMSRFDALEFESVTVPGLLQNELRASPDFSNEVTTPGNGSFSLPDFLEEIIAQATTGSTDLPSEFDGETQGAIRALIVDTSSGLASTLRSSLQDNVAGVGRELIADVLDISGLDFLDPVTDPLLATNYYAESSELIDGFLNTVFQPIGSIALPQFGPLLVNPREELAGFLN